MRIILDVKTKVQKNEDLRSTSGEQVDFRQATLKKSVKTKTLEQDELRRSQPEQKDFRTTLKKSSSNSEERQESPRVSPQKDQAQPLENTEFHTPTQSPEKEVDEEPRPVIILGPPTNVECKNGESFSIEAQVWFFYRDTSFFLENS